MTGKADAALSRLFSSAKSLNTVSDKITAQIKEIESALAAHGIGVEAWINVDKWTEDLWSDNGEQKWAVQYYASIGYAKHNGKWALLYSAGSDFGGGPTTSQLRDTAREVRISALKRLPELFDKLAEETQKLTEKAAKNLVVAREIAAALQKNEHVGGLPAGHPLAASLADALRSTSTEGQKK